MGNWRNRRRFFYHQYRDPASSYYNHQAPPPPLPGSAEDGVPLWEKKFCSLIGLVPWQKIVNAKKVIYCHNSVINWDDSAAEDAFENAKKRFWAEINCLPSQISLPDPDMYIDEINWHPDIDPELVKELEQAFFVPEEGEKDCNIEHKNKKTRNSLFVPSEGWNTNADGVITPWEGNNKIGSNVSLKAKAHGWDKWHVNTNNCSDINTGDTTWDCPFPQENEAVESKRWEVFRDKLRGWNQGANQMKDWKNENLDNDDNPWDRSFFQGNAVKGNAAGDSSNKLWGWEGNQVNQSKEWDGCDNPWECSSHTVKGKAWGNSDHISWGKNKPELGKCRNRGNSWQINQTQDTRNPKDRQWRGSGGNEEVWKWRGNAKDLKFGQRGHSQRSWDDDHRQREGNQHHVTGRKHTRFQGNDYQPGDRWKKRVTFAYD